MRISKKLTTAVGAMAFVLTTIGLARAESGSSSTELDEFWATLSRYVEQGDLEGMKSTYHSDAVLVNGINKTSYPISAAFDRWKQGILDTKMGKTKASVEFRFTQRLHDQDTAHETGIFYYTATPNEGAAESSYIHFEALLVKQGEWKMVMEYQKELATKEEWASAAP